jgi:hypothetical protein
VILAAVRPLLLSLATLLLATGSISAQTSGAMGATVQVVGSNSIVGRNLDFGTILSSQSVSVAPTAPQAGRFQINGGWFTPVTFTITSLPANLGSSSLALSAWQGRYGLFDNPGGGTTFTPVQGYSRTFLMWFGAYYVWLGATLTATNAPAGTHSAPIVVTVAFQ